MQKSNHTWNFSVVGGVKRVNLESGDDLIHLEKLDQKLWTALSCPVNNLEIDNHTLSLIDKDKDGQIRVPEILDAVKWVTTVLKNPNDLLKQEKELPLSAINDQNEEGKALLASAKIILNNLNKSDSLTLSTKDTSNIGEIFANSLFNGDGIITTNSAQNKALEALIEDIVKCVGFKQDRSNLPGVDLDLINLFFESCDKYNQWYSLQEKNAANILPLGKETEAAYQSYIAIKSKVNDYFLRCNLAEYDTKSTETLNVLLSNIELITAKDLSTCLNEIENYPLSKIEANKPLELVKGVNPAWEKAITNFKNNVVDALFANTNTLTEVDWKKISSNFEAFEKWQNEKTGTIVALLGIERIRELLSKNYQADLHALIKQDIALEKEAANIILVDQLVRYYQDLFKLLNNFVTFKDFYTPGLKSIFQAGTLYIDQRSCDLCLKVNDMPKHNVMASHSGMFLIYCHCVSKSTSENLTIVAALTNGDIDNLIVGRNALFYDREGLDWDATIIKIIENPISIKQAFWSPYRKLSNFIEKQINKVAAAQDSKINEDLSKSVESAPTKIEANAPKQATVPFDIGKFVGIFAAIGLAIGAIGTALASVIGGFLGLVWWKMPIAVLGVVLLISGPSMVLAYLKLRKRNLAPILDACGWAINAKALVNIPFGNTLTLTANLPAGAKIKMNDPFTKKKTPYLMYIVFVSIIVGIILFLLWKNGLININY